MSWSWANFLQAAVLAVMGWVALEIFNMQRQLDQFQYSAQENIKAMYQRIGQNEADIKWLQNYVMSGDRSRRDGK